MNCKGKKSFRNKTQSEIFGISSQNKVIFQQNRGMKLEKGIWNNILDKNEMKMKILKMRVIFCHWMVSLKNVKFHILFWVKMQLLTFGLGFFKKH